MTTNVSPTSKPATIKTATVDGKEIPMLCADLNQGQDLAIVSQRVLKTLTKLLPKADFREIRKEFIEQVMSTTGIKDFTELLAEQLDFHMSVNIIREYFPESVKPKAAVGVAYEMQA